MCPLQVEVVCCGSKGNFSGGIFGEIFSVGSIYGFYSNIGQLVDLFISQSSLTFTSTTSVLETCHVKSTAMKTNCVDIIFLITLL